MWESDQGEKNGNSRLRGKLWGTGGEGRGGEGGGGEGRVPRVLGDLGSISRETELERETER